MTESPELFVQIGGRDVGLEAILKKVDAEMAVSADRAAKLGQSYARLAQAQGNPAAGASILAGTLQRAGAASEQSIIGIETQAARLQNGSSYFQQFGSAASSSLLGMVAPAAAAGLALNTLVRVAQSFGDAFEFKAKLDATTASVKSQLQGFRDVGATYAEAAGFARQYNITQEEANSILQSSVGSLRTSTASVTQLETALIRLQSKDVSKPISEAARALAELESGDVTSIKELFRVSAKDALGMRDAIVAGGDSVQVLTAYLDRTATGMDALKLRAQGVQGSFNELKVANEDLALAQAKFAEGPGLTILEGKINVVRGATRLLSGDFEAMGQSLHQALVGSAADAQTLNDALNRQQGIASGADPIAAAQAAQAAQDAYTRSILEGGTEAEAAAARQAVLTAAQQQAAGTAVIASGAFDEERSAIGALQVATQAGVSAAETQAAAMQQAAQASVLDAAEKAAQKAETDQLTAATTQAVNAFLALYPTIDAAGIAAAVAAGKIPALVGQLAQLRVAAYSARDAVAALAAAQGLNVKSNIGPGGVGINAPGITSGRNNDVDAVVALQKANKDAADARAAQVIALGNSQQKVNEYERQYADAVKASGKDSAAAINAETRLKEARAAAAKPQKGGGGGGTRLSDQQKLQNSLLTSQEDYQQKSEDAAAEYARDTVKIYADFYAKMQAAQKDFDQSQLEGRAGFYDNLGSIENQKIAQAASAAYEAASVEAGKIAEEKGADVAERYMDAQEKIISDRARRQAEIEKAEKDKDAGKAEYLRGVDEQYRKAEEARLARIKEGEGSIASERDKQLSDAAQKEQDAQDKIGLSADRAADKKIAASERAGKKIDEEIAKAGVLADTYDRVGQAGSRAGITPAPTTAAATPVAAPPVAGAPAAAQTASEAQLSALDAIRAAVDAMSAAMVRATNDTTGAVRSLKNSGNIAG